MDFKFGCFVVLMCAIGTNCHPTMYKMNEHRVYEAELVPVSSTVIPLPVYQISSGLNVAPNKNDYKGMKPVGPITLITSANNKKKPYPKIKLDDVSMIKQINKKEFDN